MKIEIEIPDKYVDTNLHLMWGHIPIARYKWTTKAWETKTEFCNQCGKCCTAALSPFHPNDEEGMCKYLEDGCNGIRCSLDHNRPHGCCVGEPRNMPDCTIKWEPLNGTNIL
jgi:hypothetical protein